jgi:KaiC/GvpD/RAD55 family RecA-like ATPase
MAKYRRSKVSLDDELNIAIGTIVSTQFCRKFNLLIGDDIDLLKSKYLRIIIMWSLQYYNDYETACNTSIMDIYKAEQKNIQSEEDVYLIESALENINEKYLENKQKFDAELIYNQVEQYIKGRSLDESADRIKGLVSQGKIQEAEREQKDYVRKEVNNTKGVNVFKDMEALNELFVQEDTLFEIPGALGELVPEIVQGDFIMIGGNSKRGKSFYSMQIAMYAVQAGLTVGYWSLEMNKKLFGKRIAQFVSGKTFKKIRDKKYIPEFDKNGNILHKKHAIQQLTPAKAKRVYKLFDRQCNPGEFHLLDTTSGGSSIDSIKNTIINKSQYEGVDFDVIVIDQLSLISGAKGTEKRHQYGDTAVRIKRELCEEMGLVVFAPIQFSKQGLKIGGSEQTIAESYELFHHASLLLSLNQTDAEKDRGIMRISGSGRNDEYSGEIVSLQNFTIGRPIIDSRWKKDIPNYNEVICEAGYSEEDLQDLEDI